MSHRNFLKQEVDSLRVKYGIKDFSLGDSDNAALTLSEGTQLFIQLDDVKSVLTIYSVVSGIGGTKEEQLRVMKYILSMQLDFSKINEFFVTYSQSLSEFCIAHQVNLEVSGEIGLETLISKVRTASLLCKSWLEREDIVDDHFPKENDSSGEYIAPVSHEQFIRI
ncbi:hypothetical protein [Pleionea sp. CnH1-48]|uniref:hypothetical protein n=1 Tax=Pleionea sp. CnH1-48 TaxID=2954494 RepID=UPI0020982129|nr:hypothetical protein [Pleionea sp. CnH1-48]MCO7222953.1 hypothetical protein [Pleionea sp. CnH1-48]